ncbi:hypothetical protein AB0C76_35750 [Kitasatospora sp. NPDC048722]|uniref:hypothetical protein n=1 Tax=Kitasatospora sp. NPDC048722 TaxID=3155639 RepID=UPI0033DF276E
MARGRTRVWPGLLDGLPAPLAHYARAEEFQFDGFFDATVCAWHEKGAEGWGSGPVEFADDESDGADRLFGLLTDGTAGAYTDWAGDYYERDIDHEAVQTVLTGAPLTRRTVAALSATADFTAVAEQARSLGYALDER